MWTNEKELGLQILGYYGYGGYPPGGFLSSLLTTWGKADYTNVVRLYVGFPELGDLLRRFNAMDPESFRKEMEAL